MGDTLCYHRVSSVRQEREGFSLDAQEKLACDYANRHGLTIEKSWTVSESAWREERVAFNQLLEYAKRHPEIRHIIFDSLDRMTRNDFDKMKIRGLIEKHNIVIHFARTNKTLVKDSNPDDWFMFDIEVACAKKLSNDISRKTTMGMQEKAEQGHWPSIAPIGYKNNPVTHRIETDKERAPFIKRMFELMATGHYSQGMMVNILRKEGFRNKKGNPCQDTAIDFFLKNPIYYGPFRWKGKLFYNFKHEPIISKQLFDTAQAVRSGKTRPATRGKDFPYNHLLTCYQCGCKVLGELKKKRYHYYHCSFSKGRHHGKGYYFREEKLTEMFEEPLKRITIDDKTKDWLMKALIAESKPAMELQEKRVNALKTQLGLTGNRISRLYDAKFDGTLTEEAFVAKEREYQSLLIETKAQLAGLERVNPNFEGDASRALELCNQLHSLYVAANHEEKVKLLKLVASNYILNDVSIEAVYRKPFGFIAEGPLHPEKLPRLGSNQGHCG